VHAIAAGLPGAAATDVANAQPGRGDEGPAHVENARTQGKER
jgi:hypothetical protein